MGNLSLSLSSPLFRRAVAEAMLVGGVCGAVGVHVLLRRLAFFTHAAAHAAFPGVVLASLAGLSLFAGGAVGALALAAVASGISCFRRLGHTTATGIALAGAFASGVLLLSTRPGSSKDLEAFLVGSVLMTSATDLAATLAAGCVLVGLLVASHKELLLTAFDPLAASGMGYRVAGIHALVLTTVALTVACAVPAVGTMLVVTLLVAPALAARLWSDRITVMFGLAAGFGALAPLIGLTTSAIWGLAGGAAVTLAAVGMLALSALCVPVRHQRRGRRRHPQTVRIGHTSFGGPALDSAPSNLAR
jgi:ABC-type Mn2+/Zn2+ transport system permease subunit